MNSWHIYVWISVIHLLPEAWMFVVFMGSRSDNKTVWITLLFCFMCECATPPPHPQVSLLTPSLSLAWSHKYTETERERECACARARVSMRVFMCALGSDEKDVDWSVVTCRLFVHIISRISLCSWFCSLYFCFCQPSRFCTLHFGPTLGVTA